MKRIVFLFVLLLFPAAAFARVQIYVLFPPRGPGNKTWADFNAYLLNNPAVDGFDPALDWNTAEASQGVYDFSKFDQELQRYYATGKKVNIIVRPVLNGKFNKITPSYVFSNEWASSLGKPPLDVVTCPAYPGSGEPNSGYPAVYEAPFKEAYKKFIAAVLQHYANNPHIGYIRFGLSVGGEAFPWCHSQLPGFSKQAWLSYVDEMNAYEQSLHPTMQLMGALNEVPEHGGWDVSYADAEAASAVAHGQGIGSQGWRRTDEENYKSGRPCASDWCAMFDKYKDQVPLELQQAGESDPNGGHTTGLISDLVPFAALHHVTILEIYVKDLLLAYDPNWPSYAQYGEAHRKAFESAHQDSPK